MDLSTKLTVLSILGAIIGLVSLAISQLWRANVEIEGRTRLRMTPAGWVLLAISLVGFAGTIASEVVRKQMETDDERASTLKEARLLDATQPLSALSLRLQFVNADASLRKRMSDGRDRIKENEESSQGGTPSEPFEEVEFKEAFSPLLHYVARLGPLASDDLIDGKQVDKESLVVLIPLDESRNAFLTFAHVGAGVGWSGREHKPTDPPSRLDSPPGVFERPGTNAGSTIYEIRWTLDPAALSRAIQRVDSSVPSTGRLPKTLRIAIFYDIGDLPFDRNTFTKTRAYGLWSDEETTTAGIPFKNQLSEAELTLAINGAPEPAYRYRLRALQRKTLQDEYDDELDAHCTILVFEMQ